MTAKPPAAGTLTPPTADAVASGISLATNAAVDVISPSLLYVIPFLAEAPPVTALFIPKLPDATFNDLSILDVFNLAAVIVPSVTFVPETPEILPSVTAELAIAAVSTALSANSLEPTALAAICVAVIVSSAILAAVTALLANFPVVIFKSVTFAVVTELVVKAAVSTALSASSDAPIALAAIWPEVIVSEAIFAPVTAVFAMAAVSTALSANSFAVTELLAS